GAKGIVLGGNRRIGQCVEQRRLAYVRQADDPAAKAHFLRPKSEPKRPFSFFSATGSGFGSGLGSGFFASGFASAFASGFFSAFSLPTVCSFCIAPCTSPERQSGRTSIDLAIASSIAARSFAEGLPST